MFLVYIISENKAKRNLVQIASRFNLQQKQSGSYRVCARMIKQIKKKIDRQPIPFRSK